MSVKKVNHSSKFRKRFSKLPRGIKLLCAEKELQFIKDPFDPKLKTHKLIGKLEGFYAFSVNYAYRVMFIFEPKQEVTFTDVGPHSIYK